MLLDVYFAKAIDQFVATSTSFPTRSIKLKVKSEKEHEQTASCRLRADRFVTIPTALVTKSLAAKASPVAILNEISKINFYSFSNF